MKVRGRTEEVSVSLDYLKQLHNLHEDWLIHGRKFRPAPVKESYIYLSTNVTVIFSNPGIGAEC